MAELVAGIGTSHLAMLLRQPKAGDRERLERFLGGFPLLEEVLVAAGTEVVVLVSGEHVHKFFLDNLPAFAIGTAGSYTGPVENIEIGKRKVPGEAALAAHILEYGLRHDVDWARADDWTLDHGMMVPLHFLDPNGRWPVVPVFVNCAAPPCPTLKRCRDIGRNIAAAVRSWSHVRKVAIVAAGGLSHSPGDRRMGLIDVGFDREFLGYLQNGDVESAAAFSDERIEQAGSSTAEIRAWLVLAGAMEGQSMQLVNYEPIASFGTGCAQGYYRRAAAGGGVSGDL